MDHPDHPEPTGPTHSTVRTSLKPLRPAWPLTASEGRRRLALPATNGRPREVGAVVHGFRQGNVIHVNSRLAAWPASGAGECTPEEAQQGQTGDPQQTGSDHEIGPDVAGAGRLAPLLDDQAAREVRTRIALLEQFTLLLAERFDAVD